MKLPDRLVPIGFGVALVSLLAAGASNYIMTRRLIATGRLMTHAHQELQQLTTLLSTMQDVETGARGYVITGDQAFLEPYNRARTEAARQLDALQLLSADNPIRRARVGGLRLLAARKIELSDSQVTQRREQGFERAQQVVASGQSKRTMDDIRALIAGITAEETESLRLEQAATDAVTARTTIAVGIEGWLAIGLLLAAFIALRRENRRRRETEQQIRDINSGLERRVREATAELRESEARLRGTLDTMIEGCQIIGFDWRYLYLNPSAAAHGRQPVAQLTGRTMMEAFPGIENTKVFDAIARCMADRVPRKMETEFAFPDGSTAWFEVSIEPVREGVFILSIDITERREAQRAVEHLARQNQLLLDSAGEGVFGLDVEGNTTLVNPAAARMLGYTAAEMVGRLQHALIHHTRPDGTPYPREECRIYAAYRSGEVSRVDDEVFWRKDGTSFPVEYTSTPIRDGRGAILGAVVTFRDITERRRLEAQLRLAQKMEAMGRLAGGVAHDFNNLLSAMFMELDLGLPSVPADHPLTETLQQVRRAAEQAAGLTRQLLTFSRRQVVEATVFSLNELVGESERMLRRLIGEDVALTKRLAPDLESVRADRGQMEQVLVNLVVNARDAMPEGGKLIIETSNAVLDTAYAEQHPEVQPGPYVVMTVTDTGTGMGEDVRAHLFEPFFTTKERGKGTGLGLATSYGIVKQAGGHIAVYSEPGLGTTFRVYLPRVEPARSISPRPTPVATLRGTETILLVEDSALLRAGTRRMLAAQGYRMLEAADGTEALQRLAEWPQPVHLLLSDIVLPGLPGREVARRVREARPNIRVLFVSGYTDDVVTHQRLADEGVAFLQKPYTQETLTRKVREVLDAAPEVSA